MIPRGILAGQRFVVEPDHVAEHLGAFVAVIAARARHLDALQDVVANLNVAAAADVGEEGRIRAAEKFLAIVGRFHAQADAELHVGPHLIGDNTGRALCGENEGDAEGAAQSRDAFELRLVVRVGRDHLRELVHDDKQMREGFGQAVVAEVGRLPAVLNQILHAAAGQEDTAIIHDGLQGHEHSLDRAGLQVGEDVDHVREFLERLKRRATFVIDEHAVDDAGIVFDG